MSTTCPDCKGTGEYVGFSTREYCRRCGGSGTIGVYHPDDMPNPNPCKDIELRPMGASIKGSMVNLEGMGRHHKMCGDPMGCHPDCNYNGQKQGLIPKLTLGDTIHVFDAVWHEATATFSVESDPWLDCQNPICGCGTCPDPEDPEVGCRNTECGCGFCDEDE